VTACLLAGWVLAAPATAGGSAAFLPELTAHLERAARAAHPQASTVVVSVPAAVARVTAPACPDGYAFALRGQRAAGNVSVAVSCASAPQWGATVPASVRVDAPVVVTTRAIARGWTLAPADLAVETRPLAARATFTAIGDAAGMLARRDLEPGQPLQVDHVEAPRLVRAGDSVTLLGGSDTVTVSTRGLALADGGYGDRLRVRNVRSGIVVDAFVLGRGMVGTRPPVAAAR
jgi:flagella basal body P-ring formation protein FlgA